MIRVKENGELEEIPEFNPENLHEATPEQREAIEIFLKLLKDKPCQ